MLFTGDDSKGSWMMMSIYDNDDVLVEWVWNNPWEKIHDRAETSIGNATYKYSFLSSDSLPGVQVHGLTVRASND